MSGPPSSRGERSALKSGVQASQCSGFPRCEPALEHGLQYSWGTGEAAQSLWDLPGSGIEPMSPTMADGFLITGPPGKSYLCVFILFSLEAYHTFLSFHNLPSDNTSFQITLFCSQVPTCIALLPFSTAVFSFSLAAFKVLFTSFQNIL